MRAWALAAVTIWQLVVAAQGRAQSPPTRRGTGIPATGSFEVDEEQIAKRSMARLPAGSVLRLPSAALRRPEVEVEPSRRPAPSGEAVEEAMVKVPLAAQGAGAGHFKVSSGQGEILEGSPDGPMLALPAGGLAIVASEDSADIAARSQLREDERTPLPWLVVEGARTTQGVEVRSARPFLTLARAIRWDAASEHHVAEFLLGLEAEASRAGELAHPMVARFSVSCDDVRPELTELDAVGPRGYRMVHVECSREVKNGRDEHFLEVHAERGSLRYPFEIPRRPGPPRLSTIGSERVPGFGFGEVDVVVQRVEEDGSPLPAKRDLPVHLGAAGGRFDVPDVVMPEGQSSVRFTLYPSGLDDVYLAASLEGRSSAPLTLVVAWPVLPLVAIVTGGALGGFVSALHRGSRRRRRRRALEGILVGMIVAGLALVLPVVSALPGWARSTELGLFALAAVAGFAGTPLLDRAVGTLFPGLKESESAGHA